MYVCGGQEMINIKLVEMRKTIKEEIENVPRQGIIQNLMRQAYAALRMNSLSKNPKYPNDKNEILKIAIKDAKDYAKKVEKEFIPQYNKEFFSIK